MAKQRQSSARWGESGESEGNAHINYAQYQVKVALARAQGLPLPTTSKTTRRMKSQWGNGGNFVCCWLLWLLALALAGPKWKWKWEWEWAWKWQWKVEKRAAGNMGNSGNRGNAAFNTNASFHAISKSQLNLSNFCSESFLAAVSVRQRSHYCCPFWPPTHSIIIIIILDVLIIIGVQAKPLSNFASYWFLVIGLALLI